MDPSDKPDTDPLAATQAPPGSGESGSSGKTRSVHAGDSLGRYELGESLGEGGMASVFRARDRELRRDVAVKVMFPHLARRPEIVRRFHREARAAAGLEHENILRIYDVGGGEDEIPPFIVMELIRGRTLLEEIEQRGPLLAEIVACIGALLADALAAAHAAGIIHRDIKPSNVLIAPGGRLLLADFGVARLETEDSLVTRTGALLGTPAYMSPEQATGDTATARSDLYSLGATLYQLATGSLPYSGGAAKVMAQIASGSLVPPNSRRAAVGPDLSRIIERLMKTEPTERPESAASVASELRELAIACGFGEPVDELAGFFADPDGFVKARTPMVVSAIVSAGKRALAESRLPRAMALADRASAMAPEDPAVKTLVDAVTAGDQAKRIRRVLALGGLGLVAAGGATVLAITLSAGGGPVPHDAAVVATIPDAPTLDAGLMIPVDALVDVLLVDPTPDAGVRRDGGISRRADAGIVAVDAAVAVAIDATVVLAVDAAVSEAAPGQIIVSNDTWCELTLDGVLVTGRLQRRKILKAAPGRHSVTCTQPGIVGATWTREVDVVSDKSSQVLGSMLEPVEVQIAISGTKVQIEKIHYPVGFVAKLKPGRYRAVVFHGDRPGASGWLDIPRVASCRLRDMGEQVVCDP
ncbi:MAG: serine/threonine-protein kinase [Kofleriaceae bacterium]